jgi:glyoxylase-like metal-dependent hydrolase (beta-lactamase superfamily II)
VTHPAYDVVRRVTPVASVLLQSNPSPMTLDGTNTWLLRGPGSDETVVVDPGQADDAHLDAVLAAAPKIALVLVTHGHFDHSQVAAELHDRTGAPVRGIDPDYCRGAAPLADQESIEVAGVGLRVLATPGHSSDSASFVVGSDEAVLTGDTILGRGTTVVAHPDGNLSSYLDSLLRLRDLGDAVVLTGHGPDLPHVGDVAQMYLEHRTERLEQVRRALADIGPDATARQIVEVVYADVDQAVWWAAELSVNAQLEYLLNPPGTS